MSDVKPHNLIKQLRRQLTEILDVQNSLRFAYILFSPGEDVLQSDWVNIINLILKFSELIEALCDGDLLNDLEKIPTTILRSYYHFAVELYQMYEQVRGLTSLMIIYRTSNELSSRQGLKQRKEIYFKLKTFAYSSNEILQRASNILDEAYFPDPQGFDSLKTDVEEEVHCGVEDGSILRVDQHYNPILVLHHRK